MLRDFDRETELRLMVGRRESGSPKKEPTIGIALPVYCTCQPAVLFTELLPMRLWCNSSRIPMGVFYCNMTSGKIIVFLTGLALLIRPSKGY